MKKNKKLIYDILKKSNGHLTAEEIFLAAKKESPTMAVGTVYRNLSILVGDGQLQKVCIPGSPDRFDTEISPHQHMVCVKCGKISDVNLTDINKTMETALGVPIISCNIQINYLCENCK